MSTFAPINGGTLTGRKVSVSTIASNEAESGGSSNASLASESSATRDTTVSVEPKEDDDDVEMKDNIVEASPAPTKAKRKSPTKNTEAANGGKRWTADQLRKLWVHRRVVLPGSDATAYKIIGEQIGRTPVSCRIKILHLTRAIRSGLILQEDALNGKPLPKEELVMEKLSKAEEVAEDLLPVEAKPVEGKQQKAGTRRQAAAPTSKFSASQDDALDVKPLLKEEPSEAEEVAKKPLRVQKKPATRKQKKTQSRRRAAASESKRSSSLVPQENLLDFESEEIVACAVCAACATCREAAARGAFTPRRRSSPVLQKPLPDFSTLSPASVAAEAHHVRFRSSSGHRVEVVEDSNSEPASPKQEACVEDPVEAESKKLNAAGILMSMAQDEDHFVQGRPGTRPVPSIALYVKA